MSSVQCPTCRQKVSAPPENPCFPFCSERCRTIDLGRWLNEDFRIPVRSSDEDDDGNAPEPRPGPRQEDA